MTEEFVQTARRLIGPCVSASLIEKATQDFKVLFSFSFFYVSIYIQVKCKWMLSMFARLLTCLYDGFI